MHSTKIIRQCKRNCKIGSVFVSGLGRDYAQLIAIHFQVTQQLRNAVKKPDTRFVFQQMFIPSAVGMFCVRYT